LTLWFVASIIDHAGKNYADFVLWLQNPIVMILMVVLVSALFHHAALGLQVVIEDYIHTSAKFAAVIALRIGCFAFAAAGILSVLKIALTP
jgi:succinate dehydrogenase / fumarate reductase membrane anchor subunit